MTNLLQKLFVFFPGFVCNIMMYYLNEQRPRRGELETDEKREKTRARARSVMYIVVYLYIVYTCGRRAPVDGLSAAAGSNGPSGRCSRSDLNVGQ